MEEHVGRYSFNFLYQKQNERNGQYGIGLTLLYINPVGSVSHAAWTVGEELGTLEFKAQLLTNFGLPTYL